MDHRQVLDLFDNELRIDWQDPTAVLDRTADVVRYLSVSSPVAFISYAELTPASITRVIEEQIAYFEGLGREFEWKVYDHDWPPDLKDRLAARGFEVGEDEALAVLDLASAPERLFDPGTADLRQITAPAGLRDVLSVQEQVWGEPFHWLIEELAGTMEKDPDTLQVYCAYADGQPVSAAWVRFHQGTHFASLWGGSTLAAYRGRGIYRALVGRRAAEARLRGYRYLTVDASPMSRPILERLGFEVLSTSRPCLWRPAKAAGADSV